MSVGFCLLQYYRGMFLILYEVIIQGVELEFSEAMDITTFEGKALITHGDKAIKPIAFIWKGDTALTLAFEEEATTDSLVFVVTEGITDLAGNSFAPYTHSL